MTNLAEGFLLRMPKVELHVHLEGTFRPATLLHLAKKNGVELPADDEAGIRRWFRFRDFDQFIEICRDVDVLIDDHCWYGPVWRRE